VVLLENNVADDVIVRTSILAGSEIPWLLLRVVRSLLKTFHLAFKVENVVSLLVSQRSVLSVLDMDDLPCSWRAHR
jgi:hypothetical protein